MSSFRDTFTKEQKKDNLLDYDNSASLFFGATVLVCVLVPWTYKLLTSILWGSGQGAVPVTNEKGLKYRYCQCALCIERVDTVRRESSKWSNRVGWKTILQVILVGVLWVVFAFMALQCSQTQEIQNFDPFEILEIDSGASERTIKKAYRVMSLKLHPDKNPNDPTAQAKFIMITKAYQALTDEVSKKNYEKYGNPDGPTMMKVGIGLPRFLVEENSQLFVLIAFFLCLLVILPLIFILYYQRQKRYAQNGIEVSTLQYISFYLSEGTRMKNCPEFLASSGESRRQTLRLSDEQDIKPLKSEIVDTRKQDFPQEIIQRNYVLILAHIQRLHHLMSEPLKADLNELLASSPLIVQSMIELSLMSTWFRTAQAMIQFQVALLHCLGAKNSSLMQLPHFDEDCLKHYQKARSAPKDLSAFMALGAEDRKLGPRLNESQIADVIAFSNHVSDMEVEATAYVDDEQEMVAGDVATVKVTLTRKNLKEGEVMGPIHAPFFPELKFERWWMFLTNKLTGGLIGMTRTQSLERVVVEKIQFPLKAVGVMRLELICMCDSYHGIDVTKEITCRVLSPKEVKRELFVHPDDEALDKEPTLFQQMLGGPGEAADDSSDEEE